jgi:hypothetical protein
MKFMVDNGASRSYFEEYSNLGISPHHIHKTKAEHKYAILLLAQEISEILSERDIVPRDVAEGLGRMAEKCKEECYRL